MDIKDNKNIRVLRRGFDVSENFGEKHSYSASNPDASVIDSNKTLSIS